METMLKEKVEQELEVLQGIYSEDDVVSEPPRYCESNPESVECSFKL